MKKATGKKKSNKPTLLDKLPKNRGEYLELLIKLTERAVNADFPDKGMVDQAARLRAELEQWELN